ncbi:MAG TPA: hypothetical protein ENN21_01635 [Spirochaetes bacterium]|nr:hypothetical protein [Spirochaetota bacterium]
MFSPSTKIMIRKHGLRVDRFIHNYLYFVFYYPYVRAVKTVLPLLPRLPLRRPLAALGRMIFARYHSKVLSAGDTRKIFTLDHDMRVTGPGNRRVVPYKYAYDIIFQEPDYIAVMDCPCKLATGAPTDTVNSCIAVGRGTALFWLEHCGKYNARKISPEEALSIITDLRAKGHLTQAFFKVATGGSTGVICNCLPDTCVSLMATRYCRELDGKLSMNAPAGYSVRRDEGRCRLCVACAGACHFGGITVKDGVWSCDAGRCMGCELCVEACPEGALSLYRDPEKILPLDIESIERSAQP